MTKTKIQLQIEDIVTNGISYKRKNHLAPIYLMRNAMNNEIGVQISLLIMDCYDHKINTEDALELMPRINTIIKKFRNAGIPLDTITTTEGFKTAFNAAYLIPFSKYLTMSK